MIINIVSLCFQYGFRRRKTTGSVDTNKVYGMGGRHAVGPDYEFKVFAADAHFESFSSVTVFAADRLQVGTMGILDVGVNPGSCGWLLQ